MKVFLTRIHQRTQGFVALIATIIISLVLITAVVEQSQNSFFVRAGLLNRELKKTSSFLAYSCVQKAMQNLLRDYSYVPQNGGDVIQVGSDSCRVLTAVHGQEDAYSHKKVVTVWANAVRGGAYTNIISDIEIINPTSGTISEPSIVSYKEVPTFP